MSEQATRTPDRTIGEKPLPYFKAVDALDPDAVLAHFADDATLTVQTAHVTFTGAEEIRRMFVDFFAEWESMVHTVTNLVVDVEAEPLRPSRTSTWSQGHDRDAHLQLLHRERRRAVLARDHLDGRGEPTHVIRWPSRPPAKVEPQASVVGLLAHPCQIRVRSHRRSLAYADVKL